MVEFMMTMFLGNCFIFAMAVLLVGFMYLMRVLCMLWFDTDFGKKILEWITNADARMKHRAEVRKLRRDIAEAESRETWVIGDEDGEQ